MATKSVKKKKKKITPKKTPAKAQPESKTTAKKTKTKSVTPKISPKVAVKKPAVKVLAKNKPVKKTTAKKIVKKTPVKKAPVIKKTAAKVVAKPAAKKVIKTVSVTPPLKTKSAPAKITSPQKPVPAKKLPPKKPVVIAKPNAAKTTLANKTNLLPRQKTDFYHEQLKFWFILFFALLIVLLFNRYSGGIIGKTYADLKQEVVQNPVVVTAGQYYKYEAPANQWEYFNGESIIKNLIQSGVYFDEAWYQEGGKICDSCNGSAAPLLYIKNPSRPLPAPWVEVGQPGFYGNGQYAIHHYY
jgi:hypothetical protein